MNEKNPEAKISLHWALWLVPAVMLILALFSLPYGYYTLLRIVVCLSAGFLAYQIYKAEGLKAWLFIFAVMAVLFNPVIPIYFDRETWAPIDVAAAVAFMIHFLHNRKIIQIRRQRPL